MSEVVRFHRLRYAGGPKGSTTPFENLFARDTILSPTLGTSLWESCPLLAREHEPAIASQYFEDFLNSTIASNTVGGWTFTNATSGAITLDTTNPGGIALISAGAATQGQGVNWQMSSPIVAVGTAKMVWYETRIQVTGISSAQKIQFMAGLSTISTTLIASNTVGTTDQITFSGVSTTGVITSNTTLSTTATTGTGFTFADSTWYKLGFFATPTIVSFYVNNAVVSTSSTNIPTAALAPCFVCQGNATVTPVLNVDYIKVVAIR